MKRAIAESSQQQRNDEDLSERPSSLVNLPSNRNVLALQFTSACPVIQEINAPAAASGASRQQAETSFINIEQPKSLIVSEKCLVHSRGDAV